MELKTKVNIEYLQKVNTKKKILSFLTRNNKLFRRSE